MNPPDTSSADVQLDALIFGGGIAGLWLLNRLHQAGYRVLLLETGDLGDGQSVASQGIIHGGLKYALDGSFGSASHAIAAMPARWRASLNGSDAVDLRQCRLLSEQFFMWSDGGYRSRLKAFLGSKSLRGRVEAVGPGDLPPLFADHTRGGSLYRLPDFVVDTVALLDTLAGDRSRILKIDPEAIDFGQTGGSGTRVKVRSGSQTLDLHTRACLLCAGAGNEALMDHCGMQGVFMQTRPLHMVMLKHADLPQGFVHCIGDDFNLTPRLTLTTHRHGDGSPVWYLGGELAESGVGRSREQQIGQARSLLASLFPNLDTGAASWTSFFIDRAEGRVAGERRPDTVFLQRQGSTWVCWPTKFTLSPCLADQVLADLQAAGITPPQDGEAPRLPAGVQRPAVALPPWERLF
ncbi:MAG: hypothetical protein RLZZ385_2670 [Pseudomonadota bacterium]|jgi:glycine/D-amino acid oxidase-like deaminating enzyme